MVVTLNPQPQYAQETRHVLQLAAVARDIRQYCTIYTCYLVAQGVRADQAAGRGAVGRARRGGQHGGDAQPAAAVRAGDQARAAAGRSRQGYTESELTRLLGAGLSGARGEAVSMVVTLNPQPQYAQETRHVLQLAAVARDIRQESELTRLLGAGLSGARGEAVSMVVTLNPQPQYAQETRHVLQLAAVARDIQVNQTIQESTLESSTQDSTLASTSSGDVMRLRADNERLHFELLQAQSRNKELLAAMEDAQAENAKTMFEIAEEAKDMTRQYYEAQLRDLRAEMDEMQDEYESKLRAAEMASAVTGLTEGETPSKSLQKKVAELLTEIAILEEKLSAEKLARARAEEEVQHLRACIDERDEKAEQDSGHQEEVVVTDESEGEEEEEDPYNESLEPTFTKEDINRSRLLQQSLLNDSKRDTTTDNDDDATINDDEDTVNDQSTVHDYSNVSDKNNTIKGGSRENTKESTYYTDESHVSEKSRQTQDAVMNNSEIYVFKNKESILGVSNDTVENFHAKDLNNTKSSVVRGTYFVRDEIADENTAKPIILTESSISRLSKSRIEIMSIRDDVPESKSEEILSNPEFSNNKSSLEEHKQNLMKFVNVEESFDKSLEKSREESLELVPECDKDVIVDKPTLNKKSTISHQSDVSLANFELLEIAAQSLKPPTQPKPLEKLDTFSNLKILKEKRNYFDEENDPTNLIPKLDKSKTHYFDNITVDNKNLAEVKNILNEDRSPSIVKEDVATNNFEPSTIKKLLGESFTRQPDRLSTITTISLPKKQASVDIFDGFDSPRVVAPKPMQEKVEMSIFSTSQMEELKYIDHSNETESSITAVLPTKSLTHEKTDIFAKPKDVKPSLAALEKSLSQQKHNDSLLNYCIEKKSMQKVKDDIVGDTCRSIKEMCLKADSGHKNEMSSIKIKIERPSVEPENNDTSSAIETDHNSDSMHYNNSAEYFDNAYKDVTPRATEFELLISQNNTNIAEITTEIDKDADKPKYNLRHKINTSVDNKETTVNIEHTTDKVKSIRKKTKDTNKKGDGTNDTTVDKTNSTIDKEESSDKKANTSDEVLLESAAKCKAKPKRNLRLRRRKNDSDEKTDKDSGKLKDIVNLQKEFSDVTWDVPAPDKLVKDIESPEKNEENLPPLGIQSCPSKSVTRSRRKLFTPRAEPLEESLPASGDSTERVRVPRPSYHRTRARRKL
ncbi:hypothetical protein O0L34_g5268 [Tuta absoluta]|nr:hypothetical protein O0L34_g5268 [Tuta absoluta]